MRINSRNDVEPVEENNREGVEKAECESCGLHKGYK